MIKTRYIAKEYVKLTYKIFGLIFTIILFVIGINLINDYFSIKSIQKKDLIELSGQIDTVTNDEVFDSINSSSSTNGLFIKLKNDKSVYYLNNSSQYLLDSISANLEKSEFITLGLLGRSSYRSKIVTVKDDKVLLSLYDYKKNKLRFYYLGFLFIPASIILALWTIKCLIIQKREFKW